MTSRRRRPRGELRRFRRQLVAATRSVTPDDTPAVLTVSEAARQDARRT